MIEAGMIEIDDRLKEISQRVINILPDDEKEAYAVILFIQQILKKEFGIKDERVIEK